MLFKDLRQDAEIYIIEFVNGLSVTPASIISISSPRFEALQGGQLASSRVIDVTISYCNSQKVFVIPELIADKVITPGGTILICDETALVNELKRIKSSSEFSLKEVDTLNLRIDKCDEYLSKYDIVYKEKQENESRLSSIENSVKNLSEMFAQYIKKVKRDKDDI